MSENPYQDDLDDIRYEYVSDEDMPCHHEEYDVDWEGRALCAYCRHTWWATAEQMENHHRWEREYYEAMEQENMPLTLMAKIKGWLRSLVTPEPRTQRGIVPNPNLSDDEIPF